MPLKLIQYLTTARLSKNRNHNRHRSSSTGTLSSFLQASHSLASSIKSEMSRKKEQAILRNKASWFIRRTWTIGSSLNYYVDLKTEIYNSYPFIRARVVGIETKEIIRIAFELPPGSGEIFQKQVNRYHLKEVMPLKCEVDKFINEVWPGLYDDWLEIHNFTRFN